MSNAGWEIASYNKSYMSTDVSNTKEIKDKGKNKTEKKLLSFFRHLTNVGTPLFFCSFFRKCLRISSCKIQNGNDFLMALVSGEQIKARQTFCVTLQGRKRNRKSILIDIKFGRTGLVEVIMVV